MRQQIWSGGRAPAARRALAATMVAAAAACALTAPGTASAASKGRPLVPTVLRARATAHPGQNLRVIVQGAPGRQDRQGRLDRARATGPGVAPLRLDQRRRRVAVRAVAAPARTRLAAARDHAERPHAVTGGGGDGRRAVRRGDVARIHGPDGVREPGRHAGWPRDRRRRQRRRRPDARALRRAGAGERRLLGSRATGDWKATARWWPASPRARTPIIRASRRTLRS